MIGRMFGNYRIVDRIGEGGMGAVFRAEDVMHGRDAAIKLLRPELAHDPSLIHRFRQEARNLARVTHPNVAALYGLFDEDGVLFMAMEYARGETADAMLRRDGATSWRTAASLMTRVLEGLDAAHRRGIIHRDLKPANLIVDGGDVRITDFGIARMFGAARHTRTGAIVGTLAYMAPEQIRGEEGDARTDIYAAGMVLYELLTGAVAFTRTSEYDLMRAVVDEPARPPRACLDSVPAWLDAVVMRAIEKSPDARYQSAAEMRAAIAAGLSSVAEGDDAPAMATRVAGPPLPGATRIASMTPPPETVVARGTAGATGAKAWGSWTTKHAAGAAAAVVIIGAAGFAAASWRRDVPEPKPAVPIAQAAAPADLTSAAQANEGRVEPPSAPVMPPMDGPVPRPVFKATPPPARVVDPPAESVAPAPAPVRIVEPGPAAPPVEAAPPAAASAPRRALHEPVTFDRIKLLQNADGKVREADVTLTLDGDRFIVSARKDATVLKALPYRAITDAVFAQSKHPRWKEGGAAAVAVGVFAAPLFFMKGTKHWLTVEAGADFVVLRLDKNNFRMVLPALEARWGRTIERRAEDK
jgi:serine/threonine-protein kinase